MDKEMIIVLDFGGQYNQLIALKSAGMQCLLREVQPYTISIEELKKKNLKGIIP